MLKNLRLDQDQLKDIFQYSDDGVLVLSPQGRIVYANRSLGLLAGIDKIEQLISKSLKVLTKNLSITDDRNEVVQLDKLPESCSLEIYQSKKSVQIYVKRTEEIKWVYLKTNPIFDKKNFLKYIVVVIQDITEQRKTEERLRFLTEASVILSSSLESTTFLNDITKIVVPKFASWCAIDVLQKDSMLERIAVAHPDKKLLRLAKQFYNKYPIDLEAPIGVAKVIRTGNPELYPDITDNILKIGATSNKQLNALKKLNFRSAIIVPITARQKILGAVTFVSTKDGWQYNITDLKFAEVLGRRIGLALDNSLLYNQVQDDLKERIIIGEKLKTSELEHRTLVDLAPDVIYSIKASDGTFTALSPAFEKLTGWKIQDWLGKPFTSLVHPDDLKLALTKFNQNSDGKPTDLYQLRIKSADGGYLVGEFRSVPRFENGKVVEKFGIARDITKHKRIEEELIFQKKLLELQSDASMDGILVVSKDGKMIFYNKKFVEMWGIPEEVLKNKLDEEAINEVESKLTNPVEFRQKVQYLYAHPEVESRDEIVLKNNKIFDRYSAPIKDDKNVYYGRVYFFRDITESKKLEKRKDEFISIASHELKTPVSVIKSYNQIMEYQLSHQSKFTSAAFLKYTQKMNEQINRLTNLVNDLLNVSRIQTGKLQLKFEKFRLEALVDEVVLDLQQTSKHHIVVEGTTTRQIKADKYRIAQVLINLISNAIKFSPKSDKVIVKILQIDEQVQISVQDFGIGISRKNFTKIFGRFYQPKTSVRSSFFGLGLGLFISSEIVKRHKGTIKVESEKGQGSIFTVTLPLPQVQKNNKKNVKMKKPVKKIFSYIQI